MGLTLKKKLQLVAVLVLGFFLLGLLSCRLAVFLALDLTNNRL
jgi:hypothetical protein